MTHKEGQHTMAGSTQATDQKKGKAASLFCHKVITMLDNPL